MRVITSTGAPWFVSNEQLRQDLQFFSIEAVASRSMQRYIRHLPTHPNVDALHLVEFPTTRDLKKKTTIDLT